MRSVKDMAVALVLAVSFALALAPVSQGNCPLDQVAAPANGTATPEPSGYTNEIITFACNSGFTLVGSVMRLCTDTGLWTNSFDQVCTPVPCDALPAPANGTLSPRTTTFGSAVVVSCNAGFVRVGADRLNCSANGAFDGVVGTCVRTQRCPGLPTPANGTIAPLTCANAPTCTLTCMPGFRSTSSVSSNIATRQCQVDNTWSGVEFGCVVQRCPALVATAGVRLTGSSTFAVGELVFASCDPGYLQSSTTTLRCESTGAWNTTVPLCVPASCSTNLGPLAIPPNFAPLAIGTPASFTCSPGSTLMGSSSLVCQRSLTLAPTGRCIPSPCAFPLVQGGAFVVSPGERFVLGTNITTVCVPGRTLSGTRVRQCVAAGSGIGVTVTNASTICTVDPSFCSFASLGVVANGVYNVTNNASLGMAARAICNLGFKPVGPLVRVCSPVLGTATGAWSHGPLLCGEDEPTCSVANCVTCVVANANLCDACLPGYSGPTCAVVNMTYCPSLVAPDNGLLLGGPPVRVFGEQATFACNVGYFMSAGSAARECLSIAVWSGVQPTCTPCASQCATCATTAMTCLTCSPDSGGTAPTCIPVIEVCSELPVPSFGWVSYSSVGLFTSGTVGTYGCLDGYTMLLPANVTRVCLPTGNWNATGAPSCVPMSCVELPVAPMGGSVSVTNVSVGASVTYACGVGTTPWPAATRTCLSTRVLSGAQPVCMAIACTPPPPTAVGTARRVGAVFFGETVITSCNVGFALSPSPPIAPTCNATGYTPNTFGNCTLSQCVALPALAFGAWNYSDVNRRVGSNASLVCAPGYEPDGRAFTTTCQATALWTGALDAVRCVAQRCMFPAWPPADGQLNCSGSLVGDRCVAICDSALQLVGSEYDECRSQADFTGWTPSGARPTFCLSIDLTNVTLRHTRGNARELFIFELAWTDIAGVMATELPRDLVVEITLADQPTTLWPGPQVQVAAAESNVYRLYSTLPTRAGVYQLDVVIGGTVARPAAPYSFVVEPVAAVAAMSNATSAIFASGVGATNRIETILFTLRDAFGNIATADSIGLEVQVEVGSSAVSLFNETHLELVDGVPGLYVLNFAFADAGVALVTALLPDGAFVGSPWQVAVNASCQPGTYALEVTGPCLPCAKGLFTVGVSEHNCQPCPEFHTTATNGTAGADGCVCDVGYYKATATADVSDCLKCKDGAVCDGGLSAPRARPGFFAVGDKFLPCPVPAQCVGDSLCSRGARGFLCFGCELGYFHSTATDACTRCPSTSFGWVVFFLVAVGGAFALVIVAVGAVIGRTSSWAHHGSLLAAGSAGLQVAPGASGALAGERARASGWSLRVRSPHSLAICLYFFQIIGVMRETSFPWPSAVRHVMAVFEFANIALNVFPTECGVRSYRARFLLSVLYPLLFIPVAALLLGVVLVPGLHALRRVWLSTPLGSAGERRVFARVLLARTLFVLSPFLYLPLSRAAASHFDCTRYPDGNRYLDAARDVQCNSAQWQAALGPAVVALGVYVAGIPLGLLFVLRRHRTRLNTAFGALAVAPLFASYRVMYWYFEIALLVKRAAVVLTVIILTQSQVFLAVLLELIFGSFMLFHQQYAPYVSNIHNELEIRLNMVICLFVLFGAIFALDLFPNESARVFVTALTLATLLAGIIAIVFGVLQDLRITWRRGKAGSSHLKADLIGVLSRDLKDVTNPTLRARLAEVLVLAGVSSVPPPADDLAIFDSVALDDAGLPFDDAGLSAVPLFAFPTGAGGSGSSGDDAAPLANAPLVLHE